MQKHFVFRVLWGKKQLIKRSVCTIMKVFVYFWNAKEEGRQTRKTVIIENHIIFADVYDLDVPFAFVQESKQCQIVIFINLKLTHIFYFIICGAEKGIFECLYEIVNGSVLLLLNFYNLNLLGYVIDDCEMRLVT